MNTLVQWCYTASSAYLWRREQKFKCVKCLMSLPQNGNATIPLVDGKKTELR